MTSARDKAFADARTRAQQYARAAGPSLGKAVSIAETVATPFPTHLPFAASASRASELAKVPIQPGSQDVSVSVTVVFAIG